jgi:flagellar hook-associated protein FlgK
MVKAQHAYDAAARIITVMDDALDTVIHRMGVTV